MTIGMDIGIDINIDLVWLYDMTLWCEIGKILSMYLRDISSVYWLNDPKGWLMVSVFVHCIQCLLFFMSAALLLCAALFINENYLIWTAQFQS